MHHCVIRRYTANPSQLNVLVRHINDTLAPRLRESPGFLHYSVTEGLDAEADQVVTVTVF